jgi:NTP pyrophosphatase (non-canonical NTP hydrolase)
MSLAATLRAITTASAHMPAIPLDHPIHGALAMVQRYAARVEAHKKEARGGPSAPLGSPASLHYAAAGLAGEVGELLAELLTEEPDRAKIISEAGDALWYLDTALAIHGADLSDAVDALLAKMQRRHADRMAAAGYRPAPATIEELLREPGWYCLHHEAVRALPGGADLVVDGATVAITDEDDRAIYRVAHPTEAAAVRAALDIVAALNPR